jgi:hypothetical protein
MIERYFQTGVRLNWMPPRQVPGPTDGAVIDSPPTVTNPMIYDGMDAELIGNVHATALGLQMRAPIAYNWLVYAPGRTTKRTLVGDVLTGPMSGCPIATWTENGATYVGHVGTIDNAPDVNLRVKRGFSAATGSFAQLSAFSPANAWQQAEITQMRQRFKVMPGFTVYGLITGPGQFYSILMFDFGAGPGNSIGGRGYQRCVGGIRQVPAMSSVATRAMLLS